MKFRISKSIFNYALTASVVLNLDLNISVAILVKLQFIDAPH